MTKLTEAQAAALAHWADEQEHGLYETARRILPERRSRPTFSGTVGRLHRVGLLSLRRTQDELFYTLTEKGREALDAHRGPEA